MPKRKRELQPVAGPDLGPILKIHRGEDSYVRFSSLEHGGGLLPIAHLQVETLEQMFPEFREKLIRDAYFSLNSFWRPGTARTADLRYLNVCYSDLDYYKAGTDRAAALAGVVRAQDADLIPPASILADSGRGLYAFWLLVSPTEPGRPERYYRRHPEKLTRYRRVQMALHKVLKKIEPALEPDPQAIDASRIVRVPGSVNTRTDRSVQYWIQAGADQRGYAYTLRNLEEHFGLELEESVQPRQLLNWGGQKRIAANRSGYRALHAARLADLEHLWERRKGYREGHRNFAALIYAGTLRGYRTEDGRKLSSDEIRLRVEELAADCTPPLSPVEAAKALESSDKRYSWSDERIILHLEITPEELETLSSIRAGRPPRLKAGPKPKKLKAERQAKILELIEGPFQGRKPSLRGMADKLEEYGIQVSHQTVKNDYDELGLSGPQLEIDYTSPFLEVVEREPGAARELSWAVGMIRKGIEANYPDAPKWSEEAREEFAMVLLAGVLELITDRVAATGKAHSSPEALAESLASEAGEFNAYPDEREQFSRARYTRTSAGKVLRLPDQDTDRRYTRRAQAAIPATLRAMTAHAAGEQPRKVKEGDQLELLLRAVAADMLRSVYGSEVLQVARNLSEGWREGLRVSTYPELMDYLLAWLQKRERWPLLAGESPVKADPDPTAG